MHRRPWLGWTIAGLAIIFCALQIMGRVIYRERLPEDRSAFEMREVARSPSPAEDRHLVVLFHGYTGRPMTDVLATIKVVFPDADILAPRYSSSPLTNEDPLGIVREYLFAIDDATLAASYPRITLVGYSLGALVARKTLVCAHTGCRNDYGIAERPRHWRDRVDRMVLMAGMNRGWATHCEKVVAVEMAEGVGYDNDCRANRLPWSAWIGAEVGQRFGSLFGIGKLIMAVQRGQPFVANLRLEWLDLQAREALPPVVQLLGDIDEIVSRSDNLDQFVTAQFTFIPLRRTNHSNVIELSGPDDRERRARFVEALTWPVERLRQAYPTPPNPDYQPDSGITKVVMILHGIRDDGRWATDLGREFERTDPSARAFSRSYGYFSALYFLTPTRMEANVRWFVDQYTQLRALYPKADFNFVGHSNGTYILAESLAQYHAVTFDKVVFAGSVVQTGFNWSRLASLKKVSAVRNYRASADFVVATLPSVFEQVRAYLDVGAAGHAGFTDDFARRTESRHFAKGGHGAVFGNIRNYPALVSYVLGTGACLRVDDCEAYELPADLRTDTQSILVVALYRFSLFVWLAAVLVIGGAAYAAGRAVRPKRPTRSRWGQLWRSAIAGFSVIGGVLAFLRYF